METGETGNDDEETLQNPVPTTSTSDVRGAVPDQESCGVPSCQFLLPFHIRKQGTKRSNHLYQLSVLAKALKCTLILPSTKKSYCHSFWDRNFSFYYDHTFLSSLRLDTVSQDDFMAWVHHRSRKTLLQYVSECWTRCTILSNLNRPKKRNLPKISSILGQKKRLSARGDASGALRHRRPRQLAGQILRPRVILHHQYSRGKGTEAGPLTMELGGGVWHAKGVGVAGSGKVAWLILFVRRRDSS